MGIDEKNDGGSTSGQLTRRRFLGTSGKFLVYTSPVLTTLLTADKAMAASVQPYFVVEALNAVRGTFTGMPARGKPGSAPTAATWNMQPELNGSAEVVYQQYSLAIEGSGKYMPTTPVQVKISWFRETENTELFWWGPGPDAGSDQTVSVPVGGGTLGIGGTIVDSVEVPWPTIRVNIEYTGKVGTVTFSLVGTNPYPKSLVLSIFV